MKKKKQPSRFKKARKATKLATTALVLGGIIGAAIGLLAAPKKGKELRDDLERESERLWKQLKMKKKDVEKIVEKAFGEVDPKYMAMYAKAKSEILARVAKNKDGLSRKRYDEIVDSVMKRVSRSKQMKGPLAKLGKEFKKTWKDISKLIK